MKKISPAQLPDPPQPLRYQEFAGHGPPPASHPVDAAALEMQRILHELQVHQIELELQNEELRQARVETEAGLAWYTELFDFAPIGYVTLDAAEKIDSINHTGARLLGRERLALAGLSFAALLGPTQAPLLRATIARARESEARAGCELTLHQRSGDDAPRYLRVSATVLAPPHVRTGTLLAFEDITERKQREAELADLGDALRLANRRKDEFLATMSHELRNPLAPIRNSLALLKRIDPGSPTGQRALAIIDRQTSHITHLVDDLLEVSRMTRGKIELQRQPLELGGLLRLILEDHRESLAAHGLQMETAITTEPIWIDADATRLTQAISNLLGNAEKFTPRGGTILIELSCTAAGVTLRVRDNGVGIAPEVLEDLFQPFAQAPQPIDRHRGGLGLGLVTARGLIELHGGTVSLSSAGHGHGATATICLPRPPAPTRPACAATESATAPAAS